MDDATIATIAYADVFDCPLTREELIRWMIFDGKVPKQRKRFYHLPGRNYLVAIRDERAARQQEKWNIARRAAKIVSMIPTIQLVGVTGGLAMNNAGVKDDIDLFFIVSDNALWISRLLAIVAMEIAGIRRRPKDTAVVNKVCLNMFMTESAVSIPLGEHDCFSAHEVLQMQPLLERGNIYKRFLNANGWVKTYLPNAWREKHQISSIKHQTRSVILEFGIWILRFAELPSKAIQLWYMQKRRTNEIISNTILRFHPKDARIWVKRKLSARLARYHIPLDKIFYAR